MIVGSGLLMQCLVLAGVLTRCRELLSAVPKVSGLGHCPGMGLNPPGEGLFVYLYFRFEKYFMESELSEGEKRGKE